MALLEVRGLRKTYGLHEVLRSIDLTVESHQVVCLIGASGSGKSTLLRCLNRLEAIQDGEIVLDGDVISGPGVDADRVRREIGMVFQQYNLFPHMTVRQNVLLGPVRVARKPRDEAARHADELLARVGLANRAHSYPEQLSGGQQQRVAIVRAMAMAPRVLLLDEVTSALDPVLVTEVLDLIRSLARSGMTMILATHEMQFARELASAVGFLHEGRMVEFSPPDQIFHDPQRPETRAFLRSVLPHPREIIPED